MNNTIHKHRRNTHKVITPAVYTDLTAAPNSPLKSETLESVITDNEEELHNSKIGRKGFNSCVHLKGKRLTIASRSGPHESEYAKWAHVDVGSQFCHLSGNVAMTIAERYAGLGAAQYTGDRVGYFLDKTLKGPPQVISILNFLWEIREAKQLFKLWQPKYDYLANLASIRLGYQYGWKLFLTDLVSILESMSFLQERIKTFLDEQGRVKQGRYRVRIPGMPDSGLETMSLGSVERWLNLHYPGFPRFEGTATVAWEKIRSYEVANIRYSYWIPEMSRAQAQLRAFLDAFGLEWNARIIWDAIPWTFVLDWFVNVGDWLEQYASKPVFPVHTRVHDFSIVRKAEVDALVRYHWVRQLGLNGDPDILDHHTVHYQGSCYSRTIDIHDKPSALELVNAGFSKIKGSRLLNGLSLITVNTKGKSPVQRLPRIPKKMSQFEWELLRAKRASYKARRALAKRNLNRYVRKKAEIWRLLNLDPSSIDPSRGQKEIVRAIAKADFSFRKTFKNRRKRPSQKPITGNSGKKQQVQR